MAHKLTMVFVVGLACSLLGARAEAETASPWVQKLNARVRLVDGGTLRLSQKPGDTQRLAGLEIEMTSGFKTYWRNPGDAGGIPPGLNFTQSLNLVAPDAKALDATQVLFPTPHRYTDQAGASIGYKDKVTLPIMVVAKDKSAPVELKVSMSIGICREICIPVETDLALTLPPDAGAPNPAVTAWLMSVPLLATLDANLPQLASARLEETSTPPKLVFNARFPKGATGADLFIEGPDGIEISMTRSPPEVSGNQVKFEAALPDKAAAAALKGQTIRVTIISANGSSELTVTPQ